MESLKKTDEIKEFVVKTLEEKISRTRSVKKILEVMAEKYEKTVIEKVLEVNWKISGYNTDGSVDSLLDKFEEMVAETETLKLAERLGFALSLQLIDRLEIGGKIDSGEKMRLKDIIEDMDGNPRDRDTMATMKK